MKGLLLLGLLVAICAAVPTQLSYTLKTNYVYNVSGVVQNNGYDTVADDFMPGFYSYMSAYMVMQPIQEDDISYTFAMNLFGTVVSASNTSGAAQAPISNGKALGEDMYFTQLKTGQITQITYYSGDSMYYVDVKLGVINAFQTSIVAVGSSLTVVESDPVGNHTAQVSGAAGSDGSLLLTKSFNQADFSAFPDPTVTENNMYIEAQAVTGIHAQGYIMNSNLNQIAILTNGAPATSDSKKRAMTNATGFDMQLSGVGSLDVTFAPNNAFLGQTFAPKGANVVSTSFFEFATSSQALAKARSATILDIHSAIDALASENEMPLNQVAKIANHFRYNPQDMNLLLPLFQSSVSLSSVVVRDRLFFIVTATKNEAFLLKYGLYSSNCDIVMRATLAAAHFSLSLPLEAAISRVASLSQCEFAQGAAKTIMGQQVENVEASSFPFNKSYSKDLSLGGKIAGVNFTADVFAGTNLNCNNPQFNYEAYAEGSATAVLFGYGQQAFDAKIIYGQQNGAQLANALTLSVWGNVVYNYPIPSVACKSGNYPLAHIAPGFSVEHTLWVSIIPIVFSASASLDLSASWGWNVCPTQLSADISVTGDGAISLSGSSFTDLLLLRAGFDLEGAFETAITPQAYIHGTACEIGFEVDADNEPLTAAVTSYYQWKECKFLFFDCKWGNHNQQTWWSWNEPAKDVVLYKITYAIDA